MCRARWGLDGYTLCNCDLTISHVHVCNVIPHTAFFLASHISGFAVALLCGPFLSIVPFHRFSAPALRRSANAFSPNWHLACRQPYVRRFHSKIRVDRRSTVTLQEPAGTSFRFSRWATRANPCGVALIRWWCSQSVLFPAGTVAAMLLPRASRLTLTACAQYVEEVCCAGAAGHHSHQGIMDAVQRPGGNAEKLCC